MARSNSYKVNLVSKNEGVEYIDNEGTYRFEVSLYKKVWEIYLPCTFGDNYKEAHLTKEDEEIIVDRISKYLQTIRWFGLFRKNYEVKVIRNDD